MTAATHIFRSKPLAHLRSHPAPVSSATASAAGQPAAQVLKNLQSTEAGLSEWQAQHLLEQHGPNVTAEERVEHWPHRLLRALINPLVILLSLLAVVSFSTSDNRAGEVMVLMVVLGVLLRFVQESRAGVATARLRAMTHITATILRDGQPREVPLRNVVPGDVVLLAAGDMVPADVRLLTAKDLFLIQSSLTGESAPVEKFAGIDKRPGDSAAEVSNICFLGTSVERGSATAVVVATGADTCFGKIARSVAETRAPSSFDQGVSAFTWMMIRFMLVMAPLVFLINGLTKHDWREAFLFAVAVAVGLTPEMLPMVVSVCLSRGAIAMGRKRVIVKRLAAIQDFGAMDVLCTDKTGTLTMDHVILERHCNVAGDESEEVLLDAYLISHFQTGLRSVLDRAILDHKCNHERWDIDSYKKLDEIPFDFVRRMMSVVLLRPDGGRRLLVKGAPEAITRHCTRFELDGEICPIQEALLGDLKEEYESLGSEGFRVLAVAYRDMDEKPAYGQADEQDLVLRGYVAFLDPPKESAAPALRALASHGVRVKVLSGDDALVCRKVCHEVGLKSDQVLTGSDVEKLTDSELAEAAARTDIFARLSPLDKQRIVHALQNAGHVVGFLGDGINDAPALHAADVGISVDTAVDVAKASADLILLEKSLLVLDEGVMEGRKVFANVMKYIRMGASSSFGNMLSVVGASLFLPFVPMAPIQILANNLLYDVSQVPIPTDHVDPEQIARPRPWHISDIRRFILCMGPVSSIFDYVVFWILLAGFNCWAATAYHIELFQTGWFVESLLTQTLIIHVIRTNRTPFLQSKASMALSLVSLLVAMIGLWLPYSPLAAGLHLVPLPPAFLLCLVVIIPAYGLLAQLMKRWLLQRGRIA